MTFSIKKKLKPADAGHFIYTLIQIISSSILVHNKR